MLFLQLNTFRKLPKYSNWENNLEKLLHNSLVHVHSTCLQLFKIVIYGWPLKVPCYFKQFDKSHVHTLKHWITFLINFVTHLLCFAFLHYYICNFSVMVLLYCLTLKKNELKCLPYGFALIFVPISSSVCSIISIKGTGQISRRSGSSA